MHAVVLMHCTCIVALQHASLEIASKRSLQMSMQAVPCCAASMHVQAMAGLLYWTHPDTELRWCM